MESFVKNGTEPKYKINFFSNAYEEIKIEIYGRGDNFLTSKANIFRSLRDISITREILMPSHFSKAIHMILNSFFNGFLLKKKMRENCVHHNMWTETLPSTVSLTLIIMYQEKFFLFTHKNEKSIKASPSRKLLLTLSGRANFD